MEEELGAPEPLERNAPGSEREPPPPGLLYRSNTETPMGVPEEMISLYTKIGQRIVEDPYNFHKFVEPSMKGGRRKSRRRKMRRRQTRR
jgi:hypothetical protein